MKNVESRTAARVVLLLTVVALVGSSLVLIARANHQANQTLNVEPELQELTVGTAAILTATINPPADNHPVNIDFEHEGPAANDPGGDGNDPTPPDLSCVIGGGTGSPSPSATGTPPPTTVSESNTSCSVSYIGDTASQDTDQWRVWIDSDGVDSTTEADESEAPGAQDQGGTPPNIIQNGDGCGQLPSPNEPDCTDVVEVRWRQATAARVDCDDQSGNDRETNPSGSGSSETYQCRIQDNNGNPVNLTVRGEVENGVNDPDDQDGASYNTPDYACGAVSNGRCDVTITQNEGETGTAEICFWVERPNQTGSTLCSAENTDEVENNDLADQVEKTWVAGTVVPSGTGSASPSGGSSSSPTSTSTASNTTTTTSTSSSSSTATSTGGTGSRRVATNLSIDYDGDSFKGKAGSRNKRCQRGRLVKLKKVKPGKDATVGKDRTNRRGRWSERKARARGRFYAVVAKKVFTNSRGIRIVCRSDRSPTERV